MFRMIFRVVLATKKRITKARKFISDYHYYRRRKHSRQVAWSMAKDTL